MTHKQKIRAYLKWNKYITCFDETYKLGILNLRSRACEMPDIKALGSVRVRNREGDIVVVNTYA